MSSVAVSDDNHLVHLHILHTLQKRSKKHTIGVAIHHNHRAVGHCKCVPLLE